MTPSANNRLPVKNRPGDTVMGKKVRAAYLHQSKSSPGVWYETLHYVDDTWSCNCRGWIFQKKCRHITEDKANDNTVVPAMRRSQAQQSTGLDRIVRADPAGRTPIYMVDRNQRRFRLEED
jgi:DNA-binding GntR family transcriptional regulator